MTDSDGSGIGNGEGHGTEQYEELYNLIDGMQNGGTWDVLGNPLKADGVELSLVDPISESNDGTNGAWNNFNTQVKINIYKQYTEKYDD